jgi:predicted O-methyltransferase YrrM
MSKYSKTFRAIGQLLRNPWLLNKVLDSDEVWRNYIADKFYLQSGFPVIHPETLFGDFHETVSPYAFLDGGSLPTDLALLKKLARSIPGCKYFEIGTWRGESVANVAEVAKQCTTLNLSRKEMSALGLSQRYIDLHGFYSNGLPNVKHLEGNTLTFDFQSLNEKFDLIFIDGDHHFEMVKNDTAKVFDNLVHERSVVVWHDYARNPESIRYEVMAGILEGCPKAYHQNIMHVAHSLCAVCLPEKYPSSMLDTPVIPSGRFRIDIKYEGL